MTDAEHGLTQLGAPATRIANSLVVPEPDPSSGVAATEVKV